MTVEAVAAASGVAKTTIYRRHADRVALLRAMLVHFLPPLEPITGSDTREVLTALITVLVTTIEDYVGMSGVAVLAARDDPAAVMVRETVVQPRIDLATGRIEEWQAAGLLAADLDVDLTLATIIGAAMVTYARFGTFPPDWAGRLADHLWPVLAPAR